MLGDCIKLCTPGEIFQPVDAFSNQIRGNVFWQPVYLIFRITLPDMCLIMMRHSPERSWPFGLRASLLVDTTTKQLRILPETVGQSHTRVSVAL